MIFIPSFKLIEYIKYNNIFDVTKKVKGESENKLTASKLISHNDKMLTNDRLKYDFRPYNLDQFWFLSLQKKIKKHPCKMFFVWKRFMAPLHIWCGLIFATWQLLIVQLLSRSADVACRIILNFLTVVFGFSNCCICISKFYYLPNLLLGWVTTRSLSLRRFVALPKIVQGRLSTTLPPG